MIARVVRVLVGLACAFLVAGATMVLFVYSPLELVGDAGRAGEASLLALAAATHSAVFAAPFALLAAGVGEWRGVRRLPYYALAAIGIAALGFLAELAMEAAGEASIANAYASAAFLATGLAAGLVYWLIAGRRAGSPEQAPRRPAAEPAGAAGSGAAG